MWAVVDRFFEVLPEAPFGVRRLAPELEPGMTYGYYQVPTAIDPGGYYLYSGSKLVVDPGMNYFGMTLEEGRQFMRDHTLESEAQIATETLRYSADNPGQALGYQMGKWKFLELRAGAEAALGDGFEIRRFHEALLANGAHPMTVVERHIDRWIEGEGNP